MGLEKLKLDPTALLALIRKTVTDSGETTRRKHVKTAACLYRGDTVKLLEELVQKVFESEAELASLLGLIRIAGTPTLLRWISDELGRPLYAPPPTRRVYSRGNGTSRKRDRAPEGEQQKVNDLAKHVGLNGLMALGANLLTGCGSTFLIGRTVDDQPHLDLATADTVSVIPDPERPLKALALIVDNAKGWTVMDDKAVFQVTSQFAFDGQAVEHKLERLPVVEIHPRARWGHYWASHENTPLIQATLKCLLIDLLIAHKHKFQSHLQLAMNVDVGGKAPQPQELGETTIIMTEGSGNVQVLDLQGDPEKLLRTKEATKLETGASYGISAARMSKAKEANDEPLNERTSELLAIMGEVEADAFDLLARLSRSSSEAIAEDLAMAIDYRPATARMTPQAELDYYAELEARGYRSPIDTVMALNPEIEDEEAALDEIRQNARERMLVVDVMKGSNTPAGADADSPGLTPQQNGANGPAVRDGEKTGDQVAAEAANEAPNEG